MYKAVFVPLSFQVWFKVPMVTHHTALIYTMVLVSATDGDMTDAALTPIGEIVGTRPVFRDCNTGLLTTAPEDCANLLGEDDGLETYWPLSPGRYRRPCARSPMWSPARLRRPNSSPTRKSRG